MTTDNPKNDPKTAKTDKAVEEKALTDEELKCIAGGTRPSAAPHSARPQTHYVSGFIYQLPD